MKRKTINPHVLSLIKSLYVKSTDSKNSLWKDLAKRFESPRRNWAEINLTRLNRLTQKGDTIVVPGKVLGMGELDHDVNIYAFSGSENVQKKVKSAGGSFGTINDLIEKGKATGVKIIK